MFDKNKFGLMLILSCLIFSIFLAPAVSGDGGFYISTVDSWIMYYEEKQMGVIGYQDGIEELTLVIDIKNSTFNASQAFWIFPIASAPQDANISIIKKIDFHRSYSSDMISEVKSDLAGSIFFTTLSQAYISLLPLYIYASGTLGGSYYNDLEIYEHVEKMGFTSELISANTSQALNSYLFEKNITLPSDSTYIIDEYIGKDYSFVVSWISDFDKFKEEAKLDYDDYNGIYYGDEIYILGVKVSFPTDKIYYPLKLTSVYGEKTIPILVQVDGYVTPENSVDGLQTDYYKGYTEIEINTESKNFKEDLWIKNEAPSYVYMADFVKSNFILICVLIFILISILSSFTSAAIVYYKNKPIFSKFALLALGNFLTVFFVFWISHYLDLNKTFLKKPIDGKKEISKNTEICFRVVFLIFGLFFLSLFVLILIQPYAILLMFLILPIIGIIIYAYGFLKNPRVTLYILLFSLFFIAYTIFFVFLLTSSY